MLDFMTAAVFCIYMTGYSICLYYLHFYDTTYYVFLTYHRVNVRFKIFGANRHLKVHVILYVILYKILVLFVVINDYRCVAHCGPSIDRQFNIPLLL